MTAHVGFPTLRLVRMKIGPFELGALKPGQWRDLTRAEQQQRQCPQRQMRTEVTRWRALRARGVRAALLLHTTC